MIFALRSARGVRGGVRSGILMEAEILDRLLAMLSNGFCGYTAGGIGREADILNMGCKGRIFVAVRL